MIKIDNPNIDSISKEYNQRLKEWLGIGEIYKSGQKKGQSKDRLKSKIGNGKTIYSKMIDFVYQLIVNDNLILEKSSDLSNITTNFSKQFSEQIANYKKLKKNRDNTSFGKFKFTMESLYEKFFQAQKNHEKHGTWLAKTLKVDVCPYCNRSYTFTVGNTRPEFDHFYPKSIYPYLALSFYNLIPACHICNHIKKEQEISHNPYDQCFDGKFELVSLNDEVLNIDTYIRGNSKLRMSQNKNVDVFKLGELYNCHTDYVDEIYNKVLAYNNDYYTSLIDSFKGLGKQPEEIDRYIWGGYIEVAFHGKRPLSKLTRDLLEHFNIINKESQE